MLVQRLKMGFFSNIRKDVLAGLTVAFALIPEAISFSIMAGVDPMVGLYASFTIAVAISFFGGRPGMISAATGAMASLMGPLVVKHGVEYLFAATILTGIIQYILGLLRIGRVVTFIPQPVIVGFVNSLAIIIFMAQIPHLMGDSWLLWPMLAGTLLIIYLFPYITKAVPSALVAIIVMTIVAVSFGLDMKTVGDMGTITNQLPFFHLPDVVVSWELLMTVLPYSIALAVVGLTESLLTANLVDEMTDTSSDKNREVRGQGIANFITGFFGGMAGCAMIGQTVINVKSGGRSRLSSLVAGVFLLFLIIVLGGVVQKIPMAALVGVMVMVSISTFDWSSLRTLKRMPWGDSLVMIITVAIVVVTSNLAIGVIAGVVLSALRFGWKMARIQADRVMDGQGNVEYNISGQLFFGTMTQFVQLFHYQQDQGKVTLNLSRSHLWDQSALTALTKVIDKYALQGIEVNVIGLNEESRHLMSRLD